MLAPVDRLRSRIEEEVERTVLLDGFVHHYWDRGTGPPVFLLHGLGGSAYDWRFVHRELAEAGYRALAFEVLGAGYSDKPARADYSIPAQTRRAIRFLDALGIGRAHVVGNSYGGAIALRMAVESPDRVDRLLLLNAASMPQSPPFHVRVLRTPGLAEAMMSLSPRKVLVHTLLREIFFDAAKIRPEDAAQYAHEAGLPGAWRALISISRDIDLEALRSYSVRYTEIRRPTSILWGADDLITPVRSGRKLAETIPGARLRVLSRCGHVPHMEHPREALGWILESLRG